MFDSNTISAYIIINKVTQAVDSTMLKPEGIEKTTNKIDRPVDVQQFIMRASVKTNCRRYILVVTQARCFHVGG